MNSISRRGGILGYVLIGGLSVSAWGKPRGTADIDLLVSIEATNNIDSFCRELENEGLKAELFRGDISDPVPFLVKTYVNDIPVDMVIATKRWEDEAIRNSAIIDFNGVPIPIISPEFLIAMKLKAGGPKDLLDVKELLWTENLDMTAVEKLAKRLRVDRRLEKVKKERK